MNLCIPINEDNGLQSEVFAHFGSALAFMMVDTESGACRTITNRNQHDGPGRCAPLASLQGEHIDGMVVGGIGMGALNKLSAANIPVYFSDNPTVAEAVSAFKAGALKPMPKNKVCAHHEGQGCP